MHLLPCNTTGSRFGAFARSTLSSQGTELAIYN